MSNNSEGRAKFILTFLYVIFVVLIIVAVFRVASGAVPLTFSYILESLPNVPQLSLPALNAFEIVGDWGVFEFLRNFFNVFTSIFGVALFFSGLVINVFIFCGWLVLLLFGAI